MEIIILILAISFIKCTYITKVRNTRADYNHFHYQLVLKISNEWLRNQKRKGNIFGGS